MADLMKRAPLTAWANSQRTRFESLLKRFVEIPSVSMDPARGRDMKRMADLAKKTLEQHGFRAALLPTGGQPLIFGERIVDPKAPTITIYNHMDVQPGGDPGEWRTEPFVFTQSGDTYWGRGTTDDKGPALTALFAARHALDQGVRVNVKFLWELEEEIGSPSFESGVRKALKRLKTDFVLVSDTIWISRTRPAAPAGLRGLQGFVLRLETGTTDEHSGVCGGAARNPVAELAQLLTQMHDARTGRIKIPGVYDDVAKPTRRELADFRASGFTTAKFKRDHGFKKLRSDDALEIMKRVWARPTFEVHGLVGGYDGPGVKTVVPPRAEAKVSMRLVPDQDPGKILKLVRAFVKEKNPDVKLEAESALHPYRGVTTGPLADLVRSGIRFGFGKEPVFVREGGSIGAVPTMRRVMKCPVVFLGLSLPEHGYHAPNENYDWGQAAGGMRAFAKVIEETQGLDRGALRG